MFCVICFSDNNRLPSQVYCENEHTFHTKCIENLYNEQCPLCRERIKPTKRYNLRISKNRIENKLNCRLKCVGNMNGLIKLVRPVLNQYKLDEKKEDRFLTTCELHHMFTFYNEVFNSYGKLYDWVLKTLITEYTIIINSHPSNRLEFEYANKLRDELRSMHPIEI